MLPSGQRKEEQMLPRERVLRALSHKEADRVPIDLGGSQTGVHRIAYERLSARLGLTPQTGGSPVANGNGNASVSIADLSQQLAEPDARVLSRLGVDTRYVRPNPPDSWQPVFTEADSGDKSYVDEWGCRRTMPRGGWYYDITAFPLAGAKTVKDLDRYQWPDPTDPGRFRGLREKAMAAGEGGRYAVVTGVAGMVFERAWYLRGFEQFFLDLVENPSFVEELLDRMLDYWKRYYEAFLAEVGDLVDVVTVGDDLGTQQGPLLSLSMYRRLIKPRQKALYSFIHSRTRARVWYHSCGAIMDFIPDLIDNGVDILNPIQVAARGMDTAELKRRFGKDIVFWGGGVDSQRVLPFGSPDEVRAEAAKRLADLAPGGGYIFAPIHNIQADVPPENIVAMYETAQNYRYGQGRERR